MYFNVWLKIVVGKAPFAKKYSAQLFQERLVLAVSKTIAFSVITDGYKNIISTYSTQCKVEQNCLSSVLQWTKKQKRDVR